MSSLIEFPVAGGGTILVATARQTRASDTVFRGGGSRDVVTRSADTIQAAVSRLRPAAQSVIESFTTLPRRPDEISVTFGVELTAEAGAIIASTAATANFSVTISWNAPTADQSAGQ
jgi:hypothetical protein